MLLKNKVAVVTGAASGFGKATSLLFAKEGAKVVVVDYNETGAQSVAQEIKDLGGEAIAAKADVSLSEDVQRFVKLAVDTYGQIDILYNNAGVFLPGKVDETSEDDWDRIVNINLKSVFLASKYAMPYLKQTKGNIISTASAGGIIGFPQAAAYGATKGGVVSLTKAMAVDYAAEGIRVNCICPGTGETGLTKEVLENPEMKEGFLAPIPMKRFAQPEDVAHAALYLASAGAGYLTGVALPVDGGWTVA